MPSILIASFILFSGLTALHVYGQSDREATNQAQSTAEVRPLVPGESFERELHGGEMHIYSMQLRRGEFLRVEVKQQDIDLELKLRNSAGDELVYANFHSESGTEPISYEAPEEGKYLLEILSIVATAPAGRYSMTSALKSSAMIQDRERLAAERLLEEVGRSGPADGTEKLRQAIVKSESGIRLWRKLNDKYWLGYACNQIGLVLTDLGETRKALDYFNQALTLERIISDWEGQANTLFNTGNIYQTSGEKRQALIYYDQARSLFKAVGNRLGEADMVFRISWLYADLRERQAALDNYTEALRLFQALGNRHRAADVLNNLGLIYFRTGESQKALEYYGQALALYETMVVSEGQANALYNTGTVYTASGEHRKALDYYQRALKLYDTLSNRKRSTATLGDISKSYLKLGERQAALDNLRQALSLYRNAGDRSSEADTLAMIGDYYRGLGETNKAIEPYNQALSICRDIGDSPCQAVLLAKTGELFAVLIERQKALDAYRQALTIHRANRDRNAQADTLQNIGYIYRALGERQRARDSYSQALLLFKAMGNRQGQAAALENIGLIYLDLHQWQKALSYNTDALRLYQILNNRVKEADLLVDVGNVHYYLGDLPKAFGYYTTARQLYQLAEKPLGEANVLENMGLVSERLDDRRKAIEHYEQALKLQRDTGQHREQANALDNLARLYSELDDEQESLQRYTQLLSLQHDLGDRTGEANTLNNIGKAHDFLEEHQKALESFQQALLLWRTLGNRRGEAETLKNIGGTYLALGDKQTALEHFNQLLLLQRQLSDREGEAVTLSGIGLIQYLLGDKQTALNSLLAALPQLNSPEIDPSSYEMLISIGFIFVMYGDTQGALVYYRRVLSLSTDNGNRRLKAASLAFLGKVYSIMDEEEAKTLDYLQQSLAAYRAVGERGREVALLNDIGEVYLSRRTNMKFKIQRERDARGNIKSNVIRIYTDVQQAEKAFAQAFRLYRAVEGSNEQAKSLSGLGFVCWLQGKNQEALDYYRRALLLLKKSPDQSIEFSLMYRLMKIYDDLSNPRLSILFGKQAINGMQNTRAVVHQIDKNMAKWFTGMVDEPYRELASLLIEQGRLMEAEQVLAMLKEEEVFEFVRRDDSTVRSLTTSISFTPGEAELEKRYRAIVDRLVAISAEYDALLKKQRRTPVEEREFARLEKELETGREAFQKSLEQITTDLTGSKEDARKVETVREAQGIQETLRELGDGTVALYTVVGEHKYYLILVTPDVQKSYESPIGAADLNCKVFAFRNALQSPMQDPEPLAQELYRILIGPELAQDLEQAKARTVMWSLDGTLRYLPVAALHDGQQYLVEKYRNVVFTPLLTSNLKDKVSETWKGLGLGVSKEYQGFSALPAVTAELDGIIKDETNASDMTGALTGRVLMDERFTEETMKTELRQRYPLVHIASHFSFRPGNETNSFLLLGDGTHLDVAGIKKLSFGGVELLTLSACDTATGGDDGNGKEVEGFSVLAQRQGAKAVMATLWSVADESTQQFMEEFYRWRQAHPQATKAEAMQSAQLFLLTGKAQLKAAPTRQRAELVSFPSNQCIAQQQPFKADEKRPFAHPYYWAPFILVGNWK